MAARRRLNRPGERVFEPPQSSGHYWNWTALVGFIGLCLLVGAADGAATAPGLRTWYLSLLQPPGTPPSWVFAPVWTVLYTMVGIAGWLIWSGPGARPALRLWGWQLLLNAFWAPAFFGLHAPALALALLLALLPMIGLTILAFARRSTVAAALLLPYLIWSCYAAYLNAGFWWLNRN